VAYSAALTAATAIIAPIIPPSVAMIIYALSVGNVSVGAMFAGGAIPGLLFSAGFLVMSFVTTRRGKYGHIEPWPTARAFWLQTMRVLPLLFLPVIIVGGIFSGAFTVTESAAVGVAYTVLVGLFATPRLSWKDIYDSTLYSAVVSAVAGILLGAGAIVSYILTYNRVTQDLADLLVSFSVGPIGYMMMVVVVLFILGMLMDAVPIMIALAPLLAPIAKTYGISDVHFGLVFVVTCLVGLVTPPVGIILFMTSSVAGIKLEPLRGRGASVRDLDDDRRRCDGVLSAVDAVASQAHRPLGNKKAYKEECHEAGKAGLSQDVARRRRRGCAGDGCERARARTGDQDHPLRPHAAGRPDSSQGHRGVRGRDRQAVGQPDQGRDFPELATRHHLGDAAVGAGRIPHDVDGGARVVLELHEAGGRVHAAVPRGQRGQVAQGAGRDIGAQIGKMGEGAGFKVLGFFLLGSRHIVNKTRPINKPEDCKGLKLRVINNPVYLQTFRLLGANPVAMDPSELYLATQQGVVDGFEYPLPDLIAQKMYEVIKFVSLDAHTTDFFIISTSKKTWDAMPPDEQKMVQAAWKTACDWQWKEQPAEIEKALARLKTLVAVNEITPDNKKLFVEVTRPVYKQFEPTIGKDFLDLAIKELG
jgi:hypothetical protein